MNSSEANVSIGKSQTKTKVQQLAVETVDEYVYLGNKLKYGNRKKSQNPQDRLDKLGPRLTTRVHLQTQTSNIDLVYSLSQCQIAPLHNKIRGTRSFKSVTVIG